MDETFWVAVAFLIFVGILIYVGAPQMVLKALDDRGQRIKAELEEARRLKDEAQKLLAEYQRKQREAEREAEALGDGRAARADARERWALAGIGGVKTALSLWLVNADVPSGLAFLGLAGSIVVPTVTIRTLWRGWPRGARLWHSLIGAAPGRAAFRLAALGLPARDPAPDAGEPTVAVLGRAAEQLFLALPAARQAQFGDLPALVGRLQEDAARLRERSAEPGAAERLALPVAALEALRLDLLQLHAGAGSLDELTRDVEAARDLGRRVDAELAARDELRGTARGELTPA